MGLIEATTPSGRTSELRITAFGRQYAAELRNRFRQEIERMFGRRRDKVQAKAIEQAARFLWEALNVNSVRRAGRIRLLSPEWVSVTLH
jgi:hypothetical protein